MVYVVEELKIEIDITINLSLLHNNTHQHLTILRININELLNNGKLNSNEFQIIVDYIKNTKYVIIKKIMYYLVLQLNINHRVIFCVITTN